jgi:AmiR/NasT family two-component response regulator
VSDHVPAEVFEAALARRDIIGQAKGILMHRFTIGADRAFDLLVDMSQHENRKLAEVAADLVAGFQAMHRVDA